VVVSTRAHIVVSPHPDDAALSCGATIAALSRAGAPVTVLTCFSGPAEPPFSPLARELHRLWGDLPDPPAARMREDAAACAELGASVVAAGERDAIYRTGADGSWLYPDSAAMFGPVNPEDRGVPARVAEAGRSLLGATPARVLAPLGVGGHADHVLARQAGEELAGAGHELWFYEELPYAEDPRARALALDGRTDLRAAALGPPSAEDLRRKLAAVDAYRSQHVMLFGDGPVRVDEHERLWVRGTGSAV
jgi:LmbE family N-acetylglucosaminyl deacetylase